MSGNWAGTHTYAAPRREAPHTEAELAALVRGADRVHALGTRHSFTDLPDTTGTLIDMSGWRRPAVSDEQSRTVRVSAGTRYGVLAAQLHEAGWALHNTGSLPHISVGGATSTGTHGSGDRKGVLSTAIRALRFMDGDGELRTVERGEHDFAALAVGVGAFGVLTELTLEIEPTYQVQQNIYGALTWQDALDSIDELTSAGDSVSLFTRWDDIVWLWIKRRVADGEQVPESVLGHALVEDGVRLLGMDVDSVTDVGTPGVWYERLPHFRADREPSRGDEHQSEYFVDRRHATAALTAVRDIVAAHQHLLIWTELRTAAADDLWLSAAYQRDSFIIHFTWENRPDEVRAALQQIEAALEPFEARPHWGKLHLFDRERLAAVVPRLGDARAAFERFDPRGRFVNDHLVRVGLREAERSDDA